MPVTVIKPPKKVNKKNLDSISIFLAGSIEMGKAQDWQSELTKWLESNCPKDVNLTVYNPRRDDWNSDWRQDINEPQFFDQVSWELDRIENSDLVVIYFAPDTQSPISLLELGKVAESGSPCIVCCPKGFWRKGNVDIVCYKKGIPVVENLTQLKAAIGEYLGIT